MNASFIAWAAAAALTLAPATTPAHAQAPPQSPPPTGMPAPAAGTAATPELSDVWLVIYNVQPARAADFEALATRVREAMRTSDVPRRRQQAAGLRIHKSALPNPDGNAVYFVQIPTERDNDADRTGLDVLIEGVLPAEATALVGRLTSTLDPRNPSGNTLMLAVR
jgi:hypothetical protein